MNEAVRVLLVDGNEATREELNRMLGSQEGVTVVGEARRGQEALAAAKKLSPEVILMLTDVGAPDRDIIDTARVITEAQLPARLIIITENLTRYLVLAVKAGAAGVLSKNISRDDLIAAIREIHLWSPTAVPPGITPGRPRHHTVNEA